MGWINIQSRYDLEIADLEIAKLALSDHLAKEDKAVFRQAKPDVTAFLRPPYGGKFLKLVGSQIKR